METLKWMIKIPLLLIIAIGIIHLIFGQTFEVWSQYHKIELVSILSLAAIAFASLTTVILLELWETIQIL